jgi:hypothetical protein
MVQGADVIEAGREPDALVAEKVMGADVARNASMQGAYTDMYQRCDIGWEAVPAYSTDVAAAWHITDWIREREGHFKVTCNFGCRWEAVITLPLSRDDPRRDGLIGAWSYSSEGTNAPHAICLGALKAVGVE